MQQVGVVALFAGRNTLVLEALPGIVLGVEAGTPTFVAEGRIGECVALLDVYRGVVVQDHVHPGEADGGGVLLLSVEGNFYVIAVAGFFADIQELRAGAARRIINGGVVGGIHVADAENLCDDAADLVEVVRLLEWTEDLLVYPVPDVGLSLERDHVGKARTCRDSDRRVRQAGIAVAVVFHEQQDQDVVLVLTGVHAAAQLDQREE